MGGGAWRPPAMLHPKQRRATYRHSPRADLSPLFLSKPPSPHPPPCVTHPSPAALPLCSWAIPRQESEPGKSKPPKSVPAASSSICKEKNPFIYIYISLWSSQGGQSKEGDPPKNKSPPPNRKKAGVLPLHLGQQRHPALGRWRAAVSLSVREMPRRGAPGEERPGARIGAKAGGCGGGGPGAQRGRRRKRKEERRRVWLLQIYIYIYITQKMQNAFASAPCRLLCNWAGGVGERQAAPSPMAPAGKIPNLQC